MKLDHNDNLIGLAGVYVDDFLIVSPENSSDWAQAKQELRDLYRWGKFERDDFVLCGVRYR